VTLVVEENLANGVPQTAIDGWAPTGLDWHWTAGGPGRDGWEGSLVHLIGTRLTVNASYHGGLWHEHEPDGACRTVIQWIVPVSKAAHSVNPAQVFQYHATKPRAVQDARFAEVRRILGARAWDPNAASIAIAYAGMPEGLQKDLACPVFRGDVQELANAVVAETTVLDQPHFGHGWIQPISRYEMDVATDFIGLLYEAPATPQEDYMNLIQPIGELAKGTADFQPDTVFGLFEVGANPHPDSFERSELRTTGATSAPVDGPWGWTDHMEGKGWWRITAGPFAGKFLSQNGPQATIRLAAPVTEADCEAEVVQAEQETTARVNQEWRDWLATAPAAAGGTP
jgi:hypothetical protein